MAVEGCQAVEPYGTVAHRTIEVHRSGPDIGISGIFLFHSRQHKHTVALLCQAHGTAEGTAGEGMGVCSRGDIVVVVVALHPCRSIVEEHLRCGSVGHADGHIAGFGHENLLAVVALADGGAVADLLAAVVRLGWRCLGDALKLAEEVAHCRRLVVAVHLPYHCVAVLLVGEQRRYAVLGRNRRGVDADIAVGGTRHDLLTPVAEDIALEAWCGLGVVVCQRSRQRPLLVLVVVLDDEHGIAQVLAVETLVEEVAVPVDAEVQTRRWGLDMLACDRADRCVVARCADGSGIFVREIAHHRTAVIATTGQTVVDLRCCGIAVVVRR